MLVLVVALVWCTAEQRWTAAAWKTPLTYESDALWGMAIAKAVASGEVRPVLPKHPASFGAPFIANWDDYPSTEEGILAWNGLLARVCGLFAGLNAAVLSAHILAALSFYFVARHLRYERAFALAGALVFAFSRYAFSRGLLHLGLTLYWHVALGVLVVWWCAARVPAFRQRRKAVVCIAVAVLHGVQNPYYAGMFVQLLGLAALAQLVRRGGRQRVLAPVILIGVTLATFLLMNVDTFASRLVNGPPGEVVARDYHGLEFYALKPVELFLPVVHRVRWLHDWARQSYFAKTMLIGEAGSPYLGVIGIAALLWLAWMTFRAIARRAPPAAVPSHAWFILWIFMYSVVGGVNGVLGFVLELFRGTNRYSIFILAFLLLFLARELTRRTRAWNAAGRRLLAAGLVALALFDQVPPGLASTIAPIRQQVDSDRDLTRAIEAKLPRGAMIFQLPVADFPERGNIAAMGDYEHFRPYLYTRGLRFSYGSVRGRSREAWQKELEPLGFVRGVERLERYGFAAVWVNRKGYADRGAAVIDGLRGAGRQEVLAEAGDIVCLRLQPVARPILPPEFAAGWHRLETNAEQDWRWSSGSATLVLHHGETNERPVRMTFVLDTLNPRAVRIFSGSQQLTAVTLDGAHPAATVDLPLVLRPGANVVHFETDVPGELPGNGDPRQLAFRVWNFRVLD